MQREKRDVGWRLEQFRRDVVTQPERRGVGADQVPMAVDNDGRVRLALCEHVCQYLQHGRHRGIVERVLRVGRCEAGSEKELVLVPERHVEFASEMEYEVAAGLGPSGFDAGQVARRDAGGSGHRKLAESSVLPPLTEQHTNTRSRVHGSRLRIASGWIHDLPGHGVGPVASVTVGP